jgi:hypothetical protein
MDKEQLKAEKVVIGRKWNNPSIYALVTDQRIELQVSLEDYLQALVIELGSPAFIFSKETLKAKIFEASQKVSEEIKKVSSKVV